jgi:cyclic pyranopterin phosphate synthase
VREQIAAGTLPKGDVLAAARLAGIMAAKRTPDIVPLCHPLALTMVEVDSGLIELLAEARTVGQTGVEMEAMTAASVAALTVYDMVKGLERGVKIESVVLVSKSGGRSGEWRLEDSTPDSPLD